MPGKGSTERRGATKAFGVGRDQVTFSRARRQRGDSTKSADVIAITAMIASRRVLDMRGRMKPRTTTATTLPHEQRAYWSSSGQLLDAQFSLDAVPNVTALTTVTDGSISASYGNEHGSPVDGAHP